MGSVLSMLAAVFTALLPLDPVHFLTPLQKLSKKQHVQNQYEQKRLQPPRLNETRAFRNPRYGPGPLWDRTHPEITTPYDMIRIMARDFPNNPLFGVRAYLDNSGVNNGGDSVQRGDFEWQTYSQVLWRVKCVAAALKQSGLVEGDRVGFYSYSREEFHLIHFACSMLKLIFVPVYDTLAVNAAQYIVMHAQLKLLFVCPEKISNVRELLQNISHIANTPRDTTLEAEQNGNMVDDAVTVLNQLRIIVLDSHAPELSLRNDVGTPDCVYHTTFKLFEDSGKNLAESLPEPEPQSQDDLSMIMYTSGTTGNPKGVMLSNCACNGGATALYAKIPKVIFDEGVTFLCYLPLAHIFGVVLDSTVMRLAGRAGFFSGNISQLTEDVALLRPTVFAGVPRVFQKIHDGIREQISRTSILTRIVFFLAFYWKYMWLSLGFETAPLADKLVFNKIKQKFGGRLYVMINAGAPIPNHVAVFLRICVTDIFISGYGLTETAGLVCSTDPEDGFDYNKGSTPYCTTEVKLISVPSMDYLVTDNPPRGELCARGRVCFKGYYRDPEKTAEVLDSEGWVHTGDVCSISPEGRIKVIDRTKNLFKLAQGEYISPEEVEGIIDKCPLVQSSFVYGTPEMCRPVAIVVPNATALRSWAKTNGLGQISDDLDALCKDDRVRNHVSAQVRATCSSSGLAGFKRVNEVHLTPIPFETNTDLITPTLKLKRHAMSKHFARELQRLCALNA